MRATFWGRVRHKSHRGAVLWNLHGTVCPAVLGQTAAAGGDLVSPKGELNYSGFLFFSVHCLICLCLFCLHITYLTPKPQVNPFRLFLLSCRSSEGNPSTLRTCVLQRPPERWCFSLLPWVDSRLLDSGFERTSACESWLGSFGL